MEEINADSMFVTKTSKNFANKLNSVFLNKEKIDSLLSNLEDLRSTEGLDDVQYEELKNEYSLKIDEIDNEISSIKTSITDKMVELEGDIKAYNKEHNDLNVRLKIGELTEQDCSKKLSKLESKIEMATMEKSELGLLLDVDNTEDLQEYISINADNQKNGVQSVIGKIQDKTEGLKSSNLDTDILGAIQSKKKGLATWIRRKR
nr:CdvA-like protein [uncultured Methanolobus sp.]